MSFMARTHARSDWAMQSLTALIFSCLTSLLERSVLIREGARPRICFACSRAQAGLLFAASTAFLQNAAASSLSFFCLSSSTLLTKPANARSVPETRYATQVTPVNVSFRRVINL